MFYDLFLLFQEEGMEEIFINEIEPFILAGKFANWELPNEIMEENIINYYRQKKEPEYLEKIIINLNFGMCPKTMI